MRIKLIVDLPINKKHKAFKGAEFIIHKKKGRRGALYYFYDSNGIECAAYPDEFEIIEHDNNYDHEEQLNEKEN